MHRISIRSVGKHCRERSGPISAWERVIVLLPEESRYKTLEELLHSPSSCNHTTRHCYNNTPLDTTHSTHTTTHLPNMEASTEAPRGNVLSAPNLASIIRASLPKESSPQLKTSPEAIAIASHAAMIAVGFRMVGLGEEHKLETTSDRDDPQELPAEWNANPGSYAFRYKHSQSSMEFLLKANRMGNKVVIMGMGMGDDKTCSFDVKTQEFVSDGNLPATPKKEGASDDEIDRSIQDVFISIGRLSDLGSMLRLKVIQKISPSLQKPGYEETPESQSSNTRTEEPRGADRPQRDPLRDDRIPPGRPYPLADPLAHPRRPMPEPMPGFEDEFETQRPARGGLPGAGYPRIGDRDLYPQGLGPNDPFRGGVRPGFGGMGGGGMHPTFDDPMFAGQGQRGGYDPQVPPGARYDPMGPGPGSGGGHPRGAGMGKWPPNPFDRFGGGDFI